ncbi:hypothetical protein Mal4_57280 [Maioricimonas rarisocia]|uniref:BON domain protein n=1 Tax=Maioricimonas rarisocia TaxID=2528026 RepID=A0A517ZFX0_9PLAN|nr:hypothetical protein [Maioricimonas rarisocia]QDU41361.1 hypothetical protein Mal4_57280 [Maioricimonas rarisocia]
MSFTGQTQASRFSGRHEADPALAELIARVERTVRSRTGDHIRDLRVELEGPNIVLSGTTDTYYSKQLATHAAFGELSDHALHNVIEVE